MLNNINKQVADSAIQFYEKVASGKLMIVGALYDMHNAFNHGQCKFIIVNVNNLADYCSIKANE